jgi:hypothetical protein
MTIAIPRDSLEEDTKIYIEKIGRFDPVDIRVGGNDTGKGQVLAEYNFEPDRLIFDPPALVTIALDVTDLNDNQRDRLSIFLFDETDEIFIPVEPSYITIGDPVVVNSNLTTMTFTLELAHFSTYAVIEPLGDIFIPTPPVVEMVFPDPYLIIAVKGSITLEATIDDDDDIDETSFSVRKIESGMATNIGLENLMALYQSGVATLKFDTIQLVDGYYQVYAKGTDEFGSEGVSEGALFTIRNMAMTVLFIPYHSPYFSVRTLSTRRC